MHLTADQLKQCNLANLTALRRAMGAQPMPMAGAISAYGNASWPRRFWIETDTPLPTKEALCDFVALLPAECIVPVPDCPFASDLGAVLEKAGFGVSFEQNAMYLCLADHDVAGDSPVLLRNGETLQLEDASSPVSIDIWCRVGSKAFDYTIDTGVITAATNTNGLELYLARLDGAVVATGLLLHTGAVVGVHQVGVDPTFQGRGVARALMQQLLGRCVDRGATHVTLQASAEGEPLYRSMGFTEQFRIRNYARLK